MWKLISALTVIILTAPVLQGEEIAKLEVTPVHQFAPGVVTYKLRIVAHKDNFAYCLGWVSDDSSTPLRRSCKEINGQHTPALILERFKDMPAGDYEGFAQIFRVPNRLAGEVIATFRVIGDL